MITSSIPVLSQTIYKRVRACIFDSFYIRQHFVYAHLRWNYKGKPMDSDSFKNQCDDITKEFNIQIPCMLAERVESYASKNNTTIASVIIEALDSFLRKQ